MRHVLVHVYWGIDPDQLWKVAREDLPSLIVVLREVVESWPEHED